MQKFYTVQEVIKISRLHMNTIYRHIQEGKLKARRIGNRYRIAEEDLKKYMEGE